MGDGPFGRGADRFEESREPERTPEPWREVDSVLDRLIGPSEAEWVAAPKRSHGDPINARYEAWMRERIGAPADHEYRVVGPDGNAVYFDGRTIEVRDGAPVEVLIDAKGRYEQFLTADDDWHRFFEQPEDSGVKRILKDARRQVEAADGRPVQWWCMEARVAGAFNDAFNDTPGLAGRIEAVHRSMPDGEEGSA